MERWNQTKIWKTISSAVHQQSKSGLEKVSKGLFSQVDACLFTLKKRAEGLGDDHALVSIVTVKHEVHLSGLILLCPCLFSADVGPLVLWGYDKADNGIGCSR